MEADGIGNLAGYRRPYPGTQPNHLHPHLTRGLIFAEAVQMVLGGAMGRMTAHELVEAACKRARADKRHLRDVLAEDAAVAKHLTKKNFDRLFDPRQYLGVAESLMDRVLGAHSSFRPKTARESE